jgi:hypothetical protein
VAGAAADSLSAITARFQAIYGVSLADAEKHWLAFLDRAR